MNPSVTIKFQNKELVSVTVEKKVNVGFLDADSLTDILDDTFTLTLTGPDGYKSKPVSIQNGKKRHL